MQIVAQETAPANTGWAGHSKQGQILRLTAMAMMSDGFAGMGTHDPQFGMCGRVRHRRAREEGRLDEYLHGSHIALPYHGCADLASPGGGQAVTLIIPED